jgi:hypothetical protein
MNLFLIILSFIASNSVLAIDWKSQIIQDTQKLFSPVSILTFNKPLDIILTDDTPLGAAADHTDVNLKLIIFRAYSIHHA